MRARSSFVTLALFAAVTVLVTGCAAAAPPADSPLASPVASPVGQAAPAHSPSPPPTSRPTATPAPDVSAAFAKSVTSPTFAGAGPITGSLKIGSLEGTVSGSMALKNGDSSYDLTMDIPGVMTVSQAGVKTGGRSFEAKNGGPWFEVEGGGDSSDSPLSKALGVAVLGAHDRGVVTKLGRRLHHLVPDNQALSGDDLGLGEAYANSHGSVEFYAGDDGRLAVMSISVEGDLVQDGQTLPVEIIFDFAFDGRVPDRIREPGDVWTRFASKRHRYSIGVPSGWATVETKDDGVGDIFGASGSEFTSVLLERQPKAAADNLSGYAKAFIAAQRRDTGDRPESDEKTTVAGRPARRLTYHATINGEPAYFVVTLVMRGRDGYQLLTLGPAGYEDGIEAIHAQTVSTFALTGR